MMKAIKLSNIETLKLTSDQYSVFHQFPILSKHRNLLMTFLKNKGINCGIYYPKPLSKMKAFSNKGLENKIHSKHTTKACNEILSLPIGPHLNIKDSEYIANAIQSFRNKWLSGRVVMQRTANPCTPVRFRPQPPIYEIYSYRLLWIHRISFKQELA